MDPFWRHEMSDDLGYEDEMSRDGLNCIERRTIADVEIIKGKRFFTESAEERRSRENREALTGCAVLLGFGIFIILMAFFIHMFSLLVA